MAPIAGLENLATLQALCYYLAKFAAYPQPLNNARYLPEYLCPLKILNYPFE
jgi:hypothetical protein